MAFSGFFEPTRTDEIEAGAWTETAQVLPQGAGVARLPATLRLRRAIPALAAL
jgi:hypothetical protein